MSFLRQITRLAVAVMAISLFCGQIQVAFADFDCNTVSEIPISECEALISFYNSAGGVTWYNRNDWLITDTPCGWHGIGCSYGHVEQIDLPSNKLSGTIPPELVNLSSLRWLYLNSNQLSGSIPPELGNLASLLYLHLEYNLFTWFGLRFGYYRDFSLACLYGTKNRLFAECKFFRKSWSTVTI